MKIRLHIELQSDLLMGSGKGSGSVIDTDIVFDDFGLPFIPGKRLKGLIRNSLCELMQLSTSGSNVNLFDIKVQDVNYLFGVIGHSHPGVINFPDMELETKECLLEAIQYGKSEEVFSGEDVKNFFTYIRSQTTIDENGLAKKGSLRTSRVLSYINPIEPEKKHQFVGELGLTNEVTEHHLKCLELAARWTKHIGSQRSRGLGQIQMKLQVNNSDKWEDFYSRENVLEKKQRPISLSRVRNKVQRKSNELTYRITLRKPTIFTSPQSDASTVTTLNYIPGNVLLGYFATQFIVENQLEEPQENSDFKKIFLEGDVVFSNAYPIIEDSRLIPLPNNIHVSKDDQTTVIDIWQNGFDPSQMKSKSISGFVKLTDDKVIQLPVTKEIRSHHERDYMNGSPKEGILFSYESISPGISFSGTITGNPELLSLLCYGEKGFLGRSRTSEYGEVDIHISESNNSSKQLILEKSEATIYLQSDAIIYNEKGFSTNNVVDFAYALKVSPEKIIKASTLQSTQESFMSVWKMKKPAEISFSMGSVFKLANLTEAEIKSINEHLKNGIGERINEGFGKLAIAPEISNGQYSNFETKKQPSINSQKTNPPKGSEKFYEKIIVGKLEEAIKTFAIQKTQHVDGIDRLTSSFISRLILLNKEELKDEALKDLANREPAMNKLKKVWVGDKTLLEFLEQTNFEPADFSGILDQTKLEKLVSKEFILKQLQSKETIQLFRNTFLYHLRKKINIALVVNATNGEVA